MESFDKVKKFLHLKQREVEEKIRSIDQEMLILSQAMPESSELGTSSWQADTNTTKEAVRRELTTFASSLQNSLSKLKVGTYGLCEKCKKAIEKERLEILPTATACVNCLV